ncbi:MAG: hypothetical protein IT193_04890 [Propionibacteriaceae bacterium]|nr:hypothetical protein [Propionibacteriaceae bacterium]
MPTDLSAVVTSVVPILLLIALGMLLRRIRVLDDAGVAGLKQLVVSVSLPAVLFTTFLGTRFEPQHLWVIGIVFAVCLGMLGLGHLYARFTGGSVYTPFLFTGFELGMIGFALFTAVYGAGELPALGVLALGHEVFIWFIFVTLLRAAGSQRSSAARTARSLATSPTIIAIVAGLALNFAGLGVQLGEGPVGGAVLVTLKYLAAVIVPLVLLIVGYGARLSWSEVRSALPLVLTRLVVSVALALALGRLVFDGLLGLAPIYSHALFTLMVLPPPFIIPLFIPRSRPDDATYATNVVSVYALASVAVFVGYVLVTS